MDYLDLINRLRNYTQPSYTTQSGGSGVNKIHPKICDEAADCIAELLRQKEIQEIEAQNRRYIQGINWDDLPPIGGFHGD